MADVAMTRQVDRAVDLVFAEQITKGTLPARANGVRLPFSTHPSIAINQTRIGDPRNRKNGMTGASKKGRTGYQMNGVQGPLMVNAYDLLLQGAQRESFTAEATITQVEISQLQSMTVGGLATFTASPIAAGVRAGHWHLYASGLAAADRVPILVIAADATTVQYALPRHGNFTAVSAPTDFSLAVKKVAPNAAERWPFAFEDRSDNTDESEVLDFALVAQMVLSGSGQGPVNLSYDFLSASYQKFQAAAVAATGVLTLAANAANTETVTIGAKVYTFQTALTDVDGNVLIGATASDSIDNLIAAITLGAGAGTTYATSTTLHPTVTAAVGAGDTMGLTAKTAGVAGNAIATTETMANGSFGAATLTGGSDDTAPYYTTVADATGTFITTPETRLNVNGTWYNFDSFTFTWNLNAFVDNTNASEAIDIAYGATVMNGNFTVLDDANSIGLLDASLADDWNYVAIEGIDSDGKFVGFFFPRVKLTNPSRSSKGEDRFSSRTFQVEIAEDTRGGAFLDTMALISSDTAA